MDQTQAVGEYRERMQRLDALIHESERFPDPAMQAHVREIVSLLLALHGAGLERLFEHVAGLGEQGQAIIDALGGDGLVGPLLLLHGLHPLDVEARVRMALDSLRPHLRSHGGEVELLGVAGSAVRLRLVMNESGCTSSAGAVRAALEQAIYDAAPEVTAVEVEGESASLVQLGLLSRRNGALGSAEQAMATLDAR